MPTITLNAYQTIAIAGVSLIVGDFLKKKILFLERFCIPSSVIGGTLFAVITCILHSAGVIDISFDDTLREICMVYFFTAVGFQADLRLLKKGGKDLVVFLILVILLIVSQDLVGALLAKVMGLSSFVGLCTGSISMVGGHGTAGAFGAQIEEMGIVGAKGIATSAATFGLIAGSLIGGPIANHLIKKYDLLHTGLSATDVIPDENAVLPSGKEGAYAYAAFQITLAAGLGSVISFFLQKTGLTFPAYIGAMLAAALFRNIAEFNGKVEINIDGINDIGGIMLSFFLGMAMITLKIWELASLAVPLLILLIAQTVLMAVFALVVVFRIMGKDYDAAVLASGICGFGMGATPNAMANIKAVCDEYAMSLKAFLLIPIVGSMFADFLNSLILTAFINILQ